MQLSQLGHLGMDECVGDTHLAEPAFGTVPATKWTYNHTALPGQISLTVSDATDANLAAFFAAAAGQLYVAKGEAIVIGDVFTVGGTGDTTDNALEAAKGAAVAANDVFKVTGIGAAAVIFLHSDLAGPEGSIAVDVGDGDRATLDLMYDNELATAKGIAIEIGDIFKVADAHDTVDNALETAKGAAVVASDIFVVTGIGAHPASTCIFVGNKVAVYSFSHDKVSSLIQTAAHRAIAGTGLRAYVYTYTVVSYVTPDNTVFTLEGFGNSVILPHTAAVAREVIFVAPVGASLLDFEIRATSNGATQGVITFDDLILRGIVKEAVTPCKNSEQAFSGIWGAIQPFGGVATVSATSKNDTGLSSDAFIDGGPPIYGRFTEIRPTVGTILAYRVID